jgi:Raf kinase inhibitor-like YbhB/YbcL family protein
MALNLKDLKIESSAFPDGGRIPERHTGEGEDTSPELSWSGVPEGTRSIAIICHDPDAPLPDGFVHWVVTGIPADVTGIVEGGGDEYRQGSNGWGGTGYRGPMPPPGHGDHRYYFWVYALSVEVDEALTRREFIDEYGKDVIEQARTVGLYSR